MHRRPLVKNEVFGHASFFWWPGPVFVKSSHGK
jgi:hypothetical protein